MRLVSGESTSRHPVWGSFILHIILVVIHVEHEECVAKVGRTITSFFGHIEALESGYITKFACFWIHAFKLISISLRSGVSHPVTLDTCVFSRCPSPVRFCLEKLRGIILYCMYQVLFPKPRIMNIWRISNR